MLSEGSIFVIPSENASPARTEESLTRHKYLERLPLSFRIGIPRLALGMTAFDSELARRSRRQRLQFSDHARNDFERAIDVRLVVEPAEREPQTAAGLLVNQTHRAQDVRRL